LIWPEQPKEADEFDDANAPNGVGNQECWFDVCPQQCVDRGATIWPESIEK
jgi:hypothetical protein